MLWSNVPRVVDMLSTTSTGLMIEVLILKMSSSSSAEITTATSLVEMITSKPSLVASEVVLVILRIHRSRWCLIRRGLCLIVEVVLVLWTSWVIRLLWLLVVLGVLTITGQLVHILWSRGTYG